MDSDSIGELLRRNREKAKITLTERASATGLHPGYLSRIEKGKFVVGPALIGRMIVALDETEAVELITRYLEAHAQQILKQRDRIIIESQLKAERQPLKDHRQLKLALNVTYD